MGDFFSAQYVVSQILIVVAYVFYALTYFSKRYRQRLVAMITCNVFMILGYSLLNAWTAVPVFIIAIARDVVSIANAHRLLKGPDKKSEPDVKLLILWLVALTVATIFTQEGLLSLFIYFAVMTFTVSSWQKSPLVYRIMGVFASSFVIIYNIGVVNIAGITLESIALIFIIIGLVKYVTAHPTKKKRKKSKKETK